MLMLTSASAFAGIGLFSTPDGASCNANLQPFVQTPIHVLYLGQAGPPANGAEYRIDGMPGTFSSDYLATLQPAPNSNLNLGNGFDGTGHNVAWPAPQAFDSNGNLLLATYNMLIINSNFSVPASTQLSVVARNPPTNALFNCPLITDAGFNLHCQAGGTMRLNGGPNCTVAVEDRTWSEIRSMYR
jgi:hypothetical protein